MIPSFKLISFLGGACLAVSALAQASQDPSEVNPPTTPPASQSPSARSSDAMTPSVNARVLSGENRFKAIDTDNDGRISRSEFTLSSHQLQTGIDEPAGAAKTEKKPWWNRDSSSKTDKNASGTTDSNVGISTGSSSVELFNKLDTNKDGFLSQSELTADPDKGLKR